MRAYSSLFTVTRRDGERIVKTGALLVPREYVPYPGDTSDGGEPVHYLGNRGFFTSSSSNASADAGASWQITSPLAVTCDEVLVRLRRGDDHQVARIPFSTLGPGKAAD